MKADDTPVPGPEAIARSLGYQDGFTDGHKAAAELYKSDAQEFYNDRERLRNAVCAALGHLQRETLPTSHVLAAIEALEQQYPKVGEKP